MAYNNKTNNIITNNNSNYVLPPGFEQLSKFKFGKLILDINTKQLQQLEIISYEVLFLGGNKIECTLETSQVQFDIKTSLWHFYSYLFDMKQLQLKFKTKNGKIYICTKNLSLQTYSNVFVKTNLKGSYLTNPIQLCDIHQQQKQNQSLGHVMIKTKLTFDQQVHKQICEVVDFEGLIRQHQDQLNNNTMTVINPQIKKITKQQGEIKIQKNKNDNLKNSNDNPLVSFQKDVNFNNNDDGNNLGRYFNFSKPFGGDNRQNQINFNNISKNSEIKYVPDEESNMEDQIDKLIAQIQNRPYDSSRYIENQSESNSFYHHSPQNQNQRSNLHLSKTTSSVFPQIQRQQSKSPINKKYPPIPIANKTSYENNHTQNITQRSISPSYQNRSLGKSNNLMHTKSLSNISLNSNSKTLANHNNNSRGKLKINIHQLIVSEIQEDSYILKIFINDQFEQFYACKGSIHGEVIEFNQKTELKTVLNQVKKLRFVIYDWQNKIIGESTFLMERLIKIPTIQGIFMLNLHKNNYEYMGETVIANQSILKKIEAPSQKSLRISLQYEQLIQMVQIYVNLTKFNFQFKTCKYKIPYNKETVQFQESESHFNVFPHNKDCIKNKLIIQFWSEQRIIGTSQINLTALNNTTKTTMEMSIEPIYLYDCMFSVFDIFKKRQVGKFKLLACFGNIGQIQHLLNNERQPKKQSAKQKQRQRHQVTYQQKLGIFVKQRSTSKQIQVQVDPQELQVQSHSPFRKQKNNNQNQQKQKKKSGTYYQKQKITKKQEIQKENSNMSKSEDLKSQNQFLNQNMDMNVSSRFHELKLHQQKQDEDEENQNQDQDQKKFQRQNRASNFNKKLSKQKSVQKQATQSFIEARQLKSLTTTLTKQIKRVLECLWRDEQKNFNLLKNSIKKYLLYNFAQVPVFKNCLMEFGITHKQIQQIIGVLDPIEGMINFNILSDLVCSISLSNQVRSNLISDKKLSKYALEEYYRKSCQGIQDNIQNWLSNNVIENIITLDQNVQFNQMRAYFKNFDYKLSMSEFNIIIQYLQNLKKQNKNSKSQKLDIITNLIKKHKEQQHQQRYQESILKKIYQQDNEFQNSSLNDSKISEIHNNFNIESRIILNNNLKQRRLMFMLEQDDDDDIINQLNNHKNFINGQKKQQSKQKSIAKNNNIEFNNQVKKNNFESQEKICLQNISFARKQSKESNSTNLKYETNPYENKKQIERSRTSPQKTTRNILQKLKDSPKIQSNQHRFKVQGIQSCKDSFQCQLDRNLQYPKISLSIRSPISSVLYFNQQETVQTINCQDDFDQVQGIIQLYERSELLGHAAFVVMKNVKSMYTLRTIKDQTFCGLVSIFIQ